MKPSVLHGDLWSGNIASAEGQPAIFDPAVYYGHHEVHGYNGLLFSTHADVAWLCATATVRQRTSIICPSFCKTSAVSTLAGAAPPTMVGKAAAQQHARHTRTADILNAGGVRYELVRRLQQLFLVSLPRPHPARQG